MEDAGQAYGSGSGKTGEAFFAWLESDIIAPHGHVADPEIALEGDALVLTGTYSNASGYMAAANFLLTVENGQITFWRMRY